MTTFAKLRHNDDGGAVVECVYNRELERCVDTSDLFFVLGEHITKHHDMDPRFEILIYNPRFEPELSCSWYASAEDFELLEY